MMAYCRPTSAVRYYRLVDLLPMRFLLDLGIFTLFLLGHVEMIVNDRICQRQHKVLNDNHKFYDRPLILLFNWKFPQNKAIL